MRSLLLVLVVSCASSPKAQTMRTGGVFPAKPADCPLELNSAALDSTTTTLFDMVGFIQITDADANEPPNSPRLLALLKPQACALGGDVVHVGMSANYTYPGTLHGDDSQHIYMVLRKKGDAAPTVQKF